MSLDGTATPFASWRNEGAGLGFAGGGPRPPRAPLVRIWRSHRSPGCRDAGVRPVRPSYQFSYGSPSIPELAAAYAFGLARNHSFVDGNKRIGFATAVLFLELNGYRFTAPEVEATVQTLALAAHALDGAGYAAWLKADGDPFRSRPRARRRQ